jgi:hypothetical protein
MVALRFVTSASAARAQLRKSDSVLVVGESAYEHSPLRIEARIAFPAGTVHVRSADPPVVPGKNHIEITRNNSSCKINLLDVKIHNNCSKDCARSLLMQERDLLIIPDPK